METGSSLSSKITRRRLKNKSEPPSPPASLQAPPPPPIRTTSPPQQQIIDGNNNNLIAGTVAKAKKKAGGARLWMRFDRLGNSEVMECDRSTIMKRVAIPARDLRILGPVFSRSFNILAREKSMVVNLEFIRAIVTAAEVLILDPLCQEVLPFVDQLRQRISHNVQKPGSTDSQMSISTGRQWQLPFQEAIEGLQTELPFEFQVLETALKVVCTKLDTDAADLKRDAYPVLDDLVRNVSNKNLEQVRSLKSNLTRLLARIQKQSAGTLMEVAASNSIVSAARLNSSCTASVVSGSFLGEDDVVDLEMLLEAYFMQLDGTREKILSVREYINDTEDYVNIQLDSKRNELIELQLTLTIASFAIALNILIVSFLGMNIPCQLYNVNGIFGYFVGGTSAACFLLFLLLLGYNRWNKLLGSSPSTSQL